MVALGTNTFIYYFKGLGKVTERLHATPPAEAAVPSVVVHELEVGLLKSNSPDKRRQQLYTLLDLVTLLPLGQGEAKSAAQVRVQLERTCQRISPLNTLIAGTALHHGATLITRNVRECECVDGLRVENWHD